MKIVHISTSVSESSANTRLHKALLDMGISSKILTMGHRGPIEEVYDLKNSIPKKIMDVGARRIRAKQKELLPIRTNTPFSVGNTGYKLNNNFLIQEADIIHLHWICEMLSIHNIKQLLTLNKPIVWTCHDSWPFTGGCHVRYGCMNFTQTCGRCGELEIKNEHDITYKILKKKLKAWNLNNIVFIAPSNWMKDNIHQSILFQKNRVEVIPNTLNTEIFRPKKMKIKGYEDKINILFGATDTRTPYKGYKYVIQVLEKLLKRDETYQKAIRLHFVGEMGKVENIFEKLECKFWGYITEQEEMADIYNLADVFFFPSIDDNLPGMVMESMACGTPVVAFQTGGIPDLVSHKKNGYLAVYKDIDDLANGLEWVLQNNENNRLGMYASQCVQEKYGGKRIATEHIKLYKSVL